MKHKSITSSNESELVALSLLSFASACEIRPSIALGGHVSAFLARQHSIIVNLKQTCEHVKWYHKICSIDGTIPIVPVSWRNSQNFLRPVPDHPQDSRSIILTSVVVVSLRWITWHQNVQRRDKSSHHNRMHYATNFRLFVFHMVSESLHFSRSSFYSPTVVVGWRLRWVINILKDTFFCAYETLSCVWRSLVSTKRRQRSLGAYPDCVYVYCSGVNE